MKHFRLYTLWAALLLSALAFAAWQPIVRNFTPNDYSAGTQNWEVLPASSGWLYAANNYGLLEYDGSDWNLTGVWNSSAIHCMTEGTGGAVFAGGVGDFGVFYPDQYGQMQYTSLADSVPPSYRNFGEVWGIHFEDGTLYVQTRRYIFVRTEDGHLEVVDPAAVLYVSVLQDHCLYVASSNGIFLYSGHRLHTLQGSHLLRSCVISAMVPYDEHSILIATDFFGVFIYDGSSIRPFPTDADSFLRRNQLYSMAVGRNHIAFGTVRHGVAITDRHGKNALYIDRSQGLHNSTVLSMAFDKEENLWLGLDQGLSLIHVDHPLRYLQNSELSYGSGYTYAEKNGYAYFGTNQGLYYCVQGTDDIELVEGSLGQVWRMVEVNGHLFCCHNRGLFEVQGCRFVQVPLPEGVWNVLPLSSTQAIACTYGGFYLLSTVGPLSQVLNHLRGYDETALFAELDQLGRIWTISSRGVECLQPNATMSAVTVQLVLEDPTRSRYAISNVDNQLIISSDDSLLSVADNGALRGDSAWENRLAGSHHYDFIRLAPDSSLIYLYNGRLAVRPYMAETRSYSPFEYEIFNNSRFYVGGFSNLSFAANGDAVLGGVEGFYLLSLSRLVPEKEKADVFLRKIESLDQGLLYGENAQAFSRSALSLPFGRYMLRAHFAGNAVTQTGQLFRTRLLPVEQDFTPWSTSSSRDFALLKQGSYTLEVQMHQTNAEDVSASFVIEVDSPWYIKWWAWLIYVILFVLFVAFVVHYVRYRLALTRRRVEAEKAAEIHQQEKRILQLETEKAQFDLKSKSRELNSVLLNQVNRNELSASLQEDVRRISDLLADGDHEAAQRALRQLQARLSAGMHQDKDWKRFEENFDFVNDRFIRRLSARFPWMSKQEKKLCVYIYMGLQTKEIAPLLGLSTRGVEMMRYRVRKKMDLPVQENLRQFFDALLSEEQS